MVAKKDVRMANPGNVIPGCDCQNSNPVGVHWLRNSFDNKYLAKIKAWISNFWGESEIDDYGNWSYDRRVSWKSGVSLNFDSDPERCKRAHNGRMTLDIPGSALDELTAPDLLLLMEGLESFNGKCTRIDVFWDDYSRIVTPEDIQIVVDKDDFSMFNIASKNTTRNRTVKKNNGLLYDAVTFGRRGKKGSGKYLRIYDKNLESKGEFNCVRWECEFTQGKAQKVFAALAGVDSNLDVFATVCGALIGGCVTFVHRIPGKKHIDRLDIYNWWKLITKSLGKLSIRIAKKKNSLTGMLYWQERQVSPSLACIRKAFKSEQDFYSWIRKLLDIGGCRMNNNQRQIAEQNAGSLIYDRKINEEKSYSDYVNAMCVQVK